MNGYFHLLAYCLVLHGGIWYIWESELILTRLDTERKHKRMWNYVEITQCNIDESWYCGISFVRCHCRSNIWYMPIVALWKRGFWVNKELPLARDYRCKTSDQQVRRYILQFNPFHYLYLKSKRLASVDRIYCVFGGSCIDGRYVLYSILSLNIVCLQRTKGLDFIMERCTCCLQLIAYNSFLNNSMHLTKLNNIL